LAWMSSMTVLASKLLRLQHIETCTINLIIFFLELIWFGQYCLCLNWLLGQQIKLWPWSKLILKTSYSSIFNWNFYRW
jgi:hypothetical protein